ncbi:MFS transporter [Acinetobacter sp. UGAL515B_02]|nr:MFS transporter [Acinetobacter sp. UGAL515B_02]WON79154.1 MFS transporter [Acinetobacter sp. UGAL515B_02]
MTTQIKTPFAELSGARLFLAAFVIALSNFMVVLDTTIANVSVPHITGNLAVSASQGTWVVTSYSVAEAICVPLTGWLASRFGTVRVFVAGLIGFTLFSFYVACRPVLNYWCCAESGKVCRAAHSCH